MRERTVHLNLRVTESEKKTIVCNTRRCGLSVSEFVRKPAVEYAPKAVQPEEYRQLNQTLSTWYAAFRERGQMHSDHGGECFCAGGSPPHARRPDAAANQYVDYGAGSLP